MARSGLTVIGNEVHKSMAPASTPLVCPLPLWTTVCIPALLRRYETLDKVFNFFQRQLAYLLK